MTLRPYQIGAVDGVFEAWKQHRAVLGVMGTGGGKTSVASEIIRRTLPGRSLVLVHRNELVSQAVQRLESFGVNCEIEKAELVASTNLWTAAPCVVATIQTLISGKTDRKRMHRFNPKDFALLWIDECHFCISPSWFKTIRYFLDGNPNLKVFGCTATPDRADNESLSKVFEAVAFDVELTDLIERGYLVDVDQRMVKIESLDLSKCRVTAGDLNGRDLAEVMEYEKTLLGIADATLKTVGTKRTLVFAASVLQAERLSEIFNRHRADSANCVFGHTPDDKRKEIFELFGDGRLQILVNVGVVTHGTDIPGIEAIVMARPTKSRSLYAQCCGRGMRPLTGVVESVLIDDDSARRQAIADSPKKHLLLLDFVGNAGRHLLISSADILGGKISEQARIIARKKIEKAGAGNMLTELKLAELEIIERREASRRLGLVGTATFTATYVDPFSAFAKRAEQWQGFQQHHRLSEKQRAILCRAGYDPDDRGFAENIAIFKKIIGVSDGQRRVLMRAGYAPEEFVGMTKWEASKVIDAVAKNGWKRPQPQVS